mgnify:CR=1 FL=1
MFIVILVLGRNITALSKQLLYLLSLNMDKQKVFCFTLLPQVGRGRMAKL